MQKWRSIFTAVVLAGAVGYTGFAVGGALHKSTPTPTSSQGSSSPISSASASSGLGLQVGDMAPNFSLKTTTGTTVSLSSLRGHPVWLNFWATWCPFCNQEMPIIKKIQTADHAKIDIYGVDVQEPASKVIPFVKKKGLNYPILLDSQGAVAADYGATGLPLSIFINSSGKIAAIRVGAFLTKSQAMADVNKAL